MKQKVIDMKKLSKAQFKEMDEKLLINAGGGGKTKTILYHIDSLETGEAYLIEKKEWPIRSAPADAIRQRMKRLAPLKNFSTREMVDGSGWVVVRMV